MLNFYGSGLKNAFMASVSFVNPSILICNDLYSPSKCIRLNCWKFLKEHLFHLGGRKNTKLFALSYSKI